MDPRTSATVTAPDLLKAFQEGTGREPDEAVSTSDKLYVLLATGNDIVEALEFPISEMDKALQTVLQHLCRATGTTAAIRRDATEPPEWAPMLEAVSAAQG